MSLYDALMIGVAGLDANSKALSIASSNIANVNTVGYKASESAFSTMLASEAGGDAGAAAGVMASAQQNIAQQGLAFSTQSPTDLAIEGNGFFCVKTSADQAGQMLFTRAGSFQPDSSGNLRNSAGLYLEGWPIGTDGTTSTDPNALQAVNLSNMAGKGQATTKMSIDANLQASATEDDSYQPGDMQSGAATPDFQRTINVYDSQGGSQPVQISYIKKGPDTWAYEVSYTGDASKIANSDGSSPNPIATGTMTFDSNGSLAEVDDTTSGTPVKSADGSVNFTIPWNTSTTTGSGLQPQTINLDMGSIGKTDGTTQFDTDSTLNSSNVDGAVFGNVTGVTIGPDGTVTANYSNGLTQAAFKVPLATFANPDGLAQVSGNAYAVSTTSGGALINAADTAGSGSIQSYALEGSTVDLATEFTNMITTQRAYSASARIITTASEMLDQLLQMSH